MPQSHDKPGNLFLTVQVGEVVTLHIGGEAVSFEVDRVRSASSVRVRFTAPRHVRIDHSRHMARARRAEAAA